MLFMVGIEHPKNESSWGLLVPVFEKLGYGCATAVDDKTKVLEAAREAILLIAEEAIYDGESLEHLKEGYVDYTKDYPEFDQWIALEVPVELLKARQKRVNITLPEPLLARIDAFMQSHKEYKDRSDLLAKAADRLIRT